MEKTTLGDYTWEDASHQHIWNHFDTDGPRTTNHLEGWHHKLKNHVAHPHPNIFYLINLLKEQQASTEIKLIQYSAGGKRVSHYKLLKIQLSYILDNNVRFRNHSKCSRYSSQV
jgi:hypothetical protein